MLDLFISYYNFLTIAMNYIIKKLAFQPPKTPGYIVRKSSNKIKKDIYFISDNDNYEKPKFNNATYEYIELNKDKNFKSKKIKSELLLIKPNNHLPICIIYSHGNCGDLGYSFYDCYLLAINTNCVVLSYEYPGYGSLKKLQLSERNTYKCIKIAYTYVNKILKFESKNIFLYGFSLGTGIAFDLACNEKFPIAGLILQAPYLSIFRVIYNWRKSFFFDIFTNCDKVKKLKAITLFIQGNKDFVVPYIHGRILAKLIPQKYFYDFHTVKNGNHENLYIKDSKKIYSKINKFIKFCLEKNKEILIEPLLRVNTRDIESNIIYRSALIKNKIHIDTTSSDETNSQFSLESKEKNEINKEKIIIKSLNEEKNKNIKINKEESCDILNKNTLCSEKSVASTMDNNINYENNEQIINIMNDKDKFINIKGKNNFIDKNKKNNLQSHSEISKSVKYLNKEYKK